MRNYNRQTHAWLAISGLFLLLTAIAAGCAPANVSPGTLSAPVAAARPSQIVVYQFAATPAEVTQNQSIVQRAYRAVAMNAEQRQKSQAETGHEAAQILADNLVTRLRALGFQVEQLPRGSAAPPGALVVDGSFVNIDEGNRLRRLAIGFGAGASKLDTEVNVSQIVDGAPNQLLEFKTHAESGKMPGAAMTLGAGAAAQRGLTVAAGAASAGLAGVKTYRSTMGFLADSTAKQITAYFSQYAANQGWIGQDKVEKASLNNSAE